MRQEYGCAVLTVGLPQRGRWYLWARLYYPGPGKFPDKDGLNDPNSFWLGVDGGRNRILGNIRESAKEGGRSYFRVWHWDGGSTPKDEWREPKPIDLGELAAGKHTLTLRPREAYETAEHPISPRIDVICLTQDPEYRPSDAAARAELARRFPEARK